MRYPEEFLIPMRAELTQHGVVETRTAEEVDLSKPEGRKAAPSKRETGPTREDRAAEREGPRTTERLLDLKRRMKKK